MIQPRDPEGIDARSGLSARGKAQLAKDTGFATKESPGYPTRGNTHRGLSLGTAHENAGTCSAGVLEFLADKPQASDLRKNSDWMV